MTKDQILREGQAVNLVRNALLVAGHEMGEDGDHWPVINSTIHQMMQDYEQLQIERNVDAELKTHLGEQLSIMEKRLDDCPIEVRAEQMRILREMREVYEAYFSSIDEDQIVVMEDDVPDYIKQAEEIILTLEEDDAQDPIDYSAIKQAPRNFRDAVGARRSLNEARLQMFDGLIACLPSLHPSINQGTMDVYGMRVATADSTTLVTTRPITFAYNGSTPMQSNKPA